jgi:glutamine amidotransferase
MIYIVDYGMGNLLSVKNAFSYNNIDAKITNDYKNIKNADKLVVPGVGAFSDCLQELKNRGLFDSILEFVKSGKPYLGICLGMQILFEKSFEFGINDGLGMIKGSIKKFPAFLIKNELKIPHMGWNNINILSKSNLFKEVPGNSYYYFDHSFASFQIDENTAAICNYGIDFCAAIIKDNLFGLQFHPEKSQRNGLKLIENFGRLL